MFATTKEWWLKGEMDAGLQIWGGENVEISLRTWLCGGEIYVAKSSYVAHAFRSKFPYAVAYYELSHVDSILASHEELRTSRCRVDG